MNESWLHLNSTHMVLIMTLFILNLCISVVSISWYHGSGNCFGQNVFVAGGCLCSWYSDIIAVSGGSSEVGWECTWVWVIGINYAWLRWLLWCLECSSSGFSLFTWLQQLVCQVSLEPVCSQRFSLLILFWICPQLYILWVQITTE